VKTAADLFREADAILLDFDGPICSVFAAYPASRAVEHMLTALEDAHCVVEQAWRGRQDPHALLREIDAIDHRLVDIVEGALTTAEVAAVESAHPTPGIHEVTEAIGSRPWAIVSNNSEACIRRYLTLGGSLLTPDCILARPAGRPDRLKPSPWLVTQAQKQLGKVQALLIGDSIGDIEAAHAAGVLAVGFANKPGKFQAFQPFHPDAVIAHPAELLEPGPTS